MAQPVELPTEKAKLTDRALEIIAICRENTASRGSACRQIGAFIETGRPDGDGKSLVNLLHSEVDRLASHLFSPTDLRFLVDYENEYPTQELDRGRIAARQVTRAWQKHGTDMRFALGVFEALKYGACFLKQWPEQDGLDKLPMYRSSLVMPWNFGVWREDQTDLDLQYAMTETISLTLPEVWRRIYHLPDAKKLFARIKVHSSSGGTNDDNDSYFHSVMSTSILNTSGIAQQSQPGGIVQLHGDGSAAGLVKARTSADMVLLHEVWVQDGDDYTTIQLIEPDILLAPIFRNSNLLIGGDTKSGLHPYSLIQPNETAKSIWGRSEIADLMAVQAWISTTCDDAKRLLGLQVDKLIGISGDDIPEERYGDMRNAGVINTSAGTTITDLTPKFPAELMPMLQWQIQMLTKISGFDNMLSGQGEPGVRSGAQSSSMMRAASPRLRDRSLLVERQCAGAADLTLSLMQAKDGRAYWTDAKKAPETEFLLADLPEDRRIVVDSHSTSPVFADDHNQVIAFGLKAGFIDGHSAIEMLNLPNKDELQRRLADKETQSAQKMEEFKAQFPDEWAKAMAHGHGGGKK